MKLLLEIPEVLLFEVLNDWLMLKEYAFLDNACTNLQRRQYLMTIFQLLSSTEHISSPNFHLWAYLRNIKLKHLTLVPNSFKDDRELTFKVLTDFIQSIDVNNCKQFQDEKILQIINLCASIISLQWKVCEVANVCQINCLHKLQSLTLEFLVVDLTKALTAIATQCHSLVNLVLLGHDTSNNESVCEQILINNPSLSRIQSTSSFSLPAIVQYCPNITNVCVRNETFEVSDIVDILRLHFLKDLIADNGMLEFMYSRESHCVEIMGNDELDDEEEELSALIEGTKELSLLKFIMSGYGTLPNNFVECNYLTIEEVHMGSMSVTINSLGELLQRCLSLRYLEFYCVDGIESSMSDIFAASRPKRLTELIVTNSFSTVNSIITVMESCPALRNCEFGNAKYPMENELKIFGNFCKTKLLSGHFYCTITYYPKGKRCTLKCLNEDITCDDERHYVF